ncbi:MAG: hypothetical protein GY760_03430 [Deltaproteobacteria bacterium]|nr:hypothetical protein [Deltaproteobacteria bacterium]
MKREKRNRKLGLAVKVIMLVLLLTSCASSPVKIKVVLPPEIKFPVPPDPVGVEYSEDGEIVYVPYELWLKIADYYIDVDAVRQLYEEGREVYEE